MSKYYGGFTNEELYRILNDYIKEWYHILDEWESDKELAYDYKSMVDIIEELKYRDNNLVNNSIECKKSENDIVCSYLCFF